ncbi:MAG: FAD-dependent oxidoreductase [Steroidobacteraceae bacterium]|nr:FAD-dependent oxidoreductase [Steroidobacteraceae bacterium]
MEGNVVIVGASHAAAQAVDSLRREGFSGRLVLVGDEPELPYQRPPLSKKYLAGEFDPARLWIRPASFYEQQRCEVRLGRRAVAIDRERQSLALDDGSVLPYDALLLATGGRVRPATVPGAQLAGIHYLRTRADVDGIRADLAPGRRAVIVGAGYIGLECAASCAKLGLSVTVLEMAPRVMSRVVAPEMSAFYQAEHASHGVDLRLNTTVAAFEGGPRVSGVVCSDGSRFPADLVIVGIGIVPNVELAAEAGIACDNGIAVDEFCRTSDPKVYAIGDCCSHPSPHYRRRIRLESVDNAFEQAKTAAANICGREVRHDKIPWFWSDQYDHKLQIVGLSQDYDRVVLRGDPATRSFSCCYLKGRELVALDAVNQPRDFMVAKKVIAERVPLDLGRLGDPAVSLKEAGLPA